MKPLLGLIVLSTLALRAADRPNVLWITCEDMSLNLGCFGDVYARTPHLDALAQQGVRFTHVFASAPVCSPVRSGLITGMYATSLGTQRLRSQFPVPSKMRGFPAWLREAGYYCSNNSKTDYNVRDEPALIRAAWDESSAQAHWRQRPPGRPFFAVFNLMTSHQSRASVWPEAQFEKEVASRIESGRRHDPAAAPVPPYYPDTPAVRRTLARYHDCVTVMDQEAGAILRDLAADGLADDTIVFFFADQGMGLPRGKRLLHDTGLRMPVIIRFPAKYRGLAPAAPGGVSDRLISSIDLGPTVLSLVGLPTPEHMQGVPFLGPQAGPPRRLVFGARDRVDEVFDLARSVRDERFLYIRNFMPHLSWMQPERYSDHAEMRREMKQLAADGRLNAAQLTYAAPRRPLEELYDTDGDPHQIHNLAASAQHRDTLERMRRELLLWILGTRDAGFLTEPQVRERLASGGTPWDMARDERHYPLGRLLEAAGWVGRPDAVPRQVKLLADTDDGVRYWAAMGLRAAGIDEAEVREALRQALKDPSPVVRMEAAAALAQSADPGEAADALQELERELRRPQPDVALHAARALELLGEAARPALPTLRAVLAEAGKKATQDPWMFVSFSLEAAIEAFEAEPPTAEPSGTPEARVETYKTVGETKLQLHLFAPHQAAPAGGRPAVVFFFGGGWRAGSPKQFEPHCRYLASRGLVAITAEYRVFARHGVKPAECVADAQSAMRWVRANAARLGIDPNRLVAAGGSAGGHLAACTAFVESLDEPGTETKVSAVPNALVLFNPVLVLAPLDGRTLEGFGARWTAERLGIDPQAISPAHHVRPQAPPTLIFHGRADTTVPFATAEVFTERMKAAGNRCELVGFEGQPHGFFNFGRNQNRFFVATLQRMDQFLVSLGYLSGPARVEEFVAAETERK